MGGVLGALLGQGGGDRGEPGRRLPHTIRFSDREWDKIGYIAAQQGKDPATFVRESALEDLGG